MYATETKVKGRKGVAGEEEKMEEERPVSDMEYCSAKDAWEKLRIRIKWTDPPISGDASTCMMSPLTIKLCIECEKPIILRNFSAFVWTSVYHQEAKTTVNKPSDKIVTLSSTRTIVVEDCEQFFKPLQDNPKGIYREIELKYKEDSRKWDETGLTTYEFSTVVFPTSFGEYRLTYNVKYIRPDNVKVMVWANEFQDDCRLLVNDPDPGNEWMKEISFSQMTQNMFLGNYKSILAAEDLGFDAVLNFDPETEMEADSVLSANITRAFQAMEVGTGSAFELPPEKIQDLVKWLWNVYPKYQKILIGDRDGISHAGSAMTSYIFANNPNLTFEEAYRYVSSRRFIYCHKGLKEILMESYPRD
ncbi:dual specificity protein phosphatase family protein [Biomphalaria pfeifferi]|uniref:Dual specificity protein phosphatase family protein n=1 Tax=Biomphalaria pfeifferi TaxID=112525 RepID=A0AAD8EW05_BIOPF|nr:dual specificity protein phosphatase family protein [Biomphalaria pfeifferi]